MHVLVVNSFRILKLFLFCYNIVLADPVHDMEAIFHPP